ncbi:MAG TPA: TIGR00282 family metallophosphoesterase [Patescibacteria group bacterium]|nr:TIGR00282 family metallophosphoesterase [Patescibacteria group bacterium]
MKILFFGDVVGKIGRRAIAEIVPKYRKKYKPDLVIANGENLAHGVGVTEDTLQEVLAAGVDLVTTGNHVFAKKGYEELFTNFENKIIRPANYPDGLPGRGYATVKIKNKRVCVINLNGRVFMQENFEDPFREFDQIEKLLKIAKSDIVVVDFHAEATSEKNAFSWYVDGRASAVLGTHTHVPTSDARILPKGTALVSDVGMVGAKDGVIGVEIAGPLNLFLTQIPTRFEYAEEGVVQVNAVLVEVDEKNGRAKKIERVDGEVNI